jgi:hypothetical protein
MKKILIFLVSVIFLLGTILLIPFVQTDSIGSSNTVGTSIKEKIGIGKVIGEHLEAEDVIVENVLVNKESQLTIITFEEEGSVEIKGNKFDDVLRGSEMKINNQGEIIEANLIIGETGGVYTLNAPSKIFTFEAPKNSRVIKEEGKPPVIFLPYEEEANINLVSKNKEEVIYEGDFFKINGNFVSKRGNDNVRVTTSGKDIIKISGKSAINLNGMSHLITSEKDLNLYYDENFDASKHQGENYFNYGKNKISLGGKGFSSSLLENTEIFPEYIQNKYSDSFAERKGKLEFIVKDGSMDIIKISPDGSPLALDIKASGNLKINNGNWVLEADGENVYANINKEYQFPLSSDMQLNYQTNNAGSKTYDLDVETTYMELPSESEKREIISELEGLSVLKQEKSEERNTLLLSPEIGIANKNLNKKQEELNKVYEEFANYKSRLFDARERGASPEEIEEIQNNRLETLEKVRALESEITYLKENTVLKKIYDLNYEIDDLDFRMGDLNRLYRMGRVKGGAFGQILSSKDTNVEVSYSEFIEGFPVIKNSDVKIYDFDTGTQRVYEFGSDVLDLKVDSKYQTCADTQIELYSLWNLQELEKGNINNIPFKISNGHTLNYNAGGTYTIWSTKENKIITKTFSRKNYMESFNEWVTNIQIYSNTGSLRNNLKGVEDLETLKPGDLITLHPDPQTGYGHTKSIKRVFKIPPTEDGEIYYQLFAGSDPPIDARVYSKMINQEQLLELISSGEAVVLTWK